jgi:hypothetical protein
LTVFISLLQKTAAIDLSITANGSFWGVNRYFLKMKHKKTASKN